MPKIKTHSGAKKRFKLTKNGKVKRGHAFRSHLLNGHGKTRKLKTIGDKWSYLQRSKFGANAQPFYILLNDQGEPLGPSYAFNESVPDYIKFLENGLKVFKEQGK